MKEETIKLFLEEGFQLSKEVLPLIEKDPEGILSKLKKLKPRPIFITKETLNGLVTLPSPLKMKILKVFKSKNPPFSISDYLNHFLMRFEKMKDILFKKIGKEKVVSINKISPKLNNFFLIGLVREIGKDFILLEDPTGEIKLFFEKILQPELTSIWLDDVIGVSCCRKNGKYFVRKVIFPDIPLDRKIVKTDEEKYLLILTSPKKEKLKKIKEFIKTLHSPYFLVVFSNEKVLEELKPLFIDENTPPMLFQIDSLKVLTLNKNFYKNIKRTESIQFLTALLKRRHLYPFFSLNKSTKEDVFILDEIPDVVIANFEGSGHGNYKGTTIVVNDDPGKLFLVNLKTREVEEKIF